MNRLTKIAIWLGLVGLGLLLLVIASGVAHPNPLFNYGSVIGLLLLVFSIFFFVIGWVFDMKCEVKRKNWIGVAILLIAAVLCLYSFFYYTYKFKLNKIAARWPAKAVTQFFFF